MSVLLCIELPLVYPDFLTRVDEARATLERLHAEPAAADPQRPVPPGTIVAFHQALRTVAAQDDLQRLRLDGLQGFTMAYLHRRVSGTLREVDRLIADNPRLQDLHRN